MCEWLNLNLDFTGYLYRSTCILVNIHSDDDNDDDDDDGGDDDDGDDDDDDDDDDDGHSHVDVYLWLCHNDIDSSGYTLLALLV